MPTIEIYTKANCPYCEWAKDLLRKKKAAYTEFRIDLDPNALAQMQSRTTGRTVPQIFINNQHIGGFDDLSALDRAGKLDELLR